MKISIKHGIQLVGLPLVLSSGKSESVCFLIDTGATHNVLFDFVYEHLKDEVKPIEGSQQIIGIEGDCKKVHLVEATFDFDGYACSSTFAVMNVSKAVQQMHDETGIQIHGILGIQFLLANKCILDFNRLQISISDGTNIHITSS